MNISSSNCITVSGLTNVEVNSYFEKFGEAYWAADENIVCIPVAEMKEFRISELEIFFGVTLSKLTRYLIVRLDPFKK